MHFLPREKGFTLVELLIVVVIISVLSAVGMAVFGSQQPKSRDARRKADINAIADAMEANYDKDASPGTYAPLADTFFSGGATPTDPLAGKSKCGTGNDQACRYCVMYSSASTAPTAAVFTENTDTSATTTSCTGGGTGTANLGPGAPGSNKYWVICANLETNSGPGGNYWYCRQSRQS